MVDLSSDALNLESDLQLAGDSAGIESNATSSHCCLQRPTGGPAQTGRSVVASHKTCILLGSLSQTLGGPESHAADSAPDTSRSTPMHYQDDVYAGSSAALSMQDVAVGVPGPLTPSLDTYPGLG